MYFSEFDLYTRVNQYLTKVGSFQQSHTCLWKVGVVYIKYMYQPLN